MRNVQTVQLRKKMKKRSGAAILQALVLFLSLQFSRAAIRYTERKAEFNVRKEHLDAAENIFFLTIKLGDETPRPVHSVCPPHWCSLTVEEEKWEGDKLRVRYSVTLVRPVEPWLAGELRLCWGDKNTFRAYPATPNYYSTKIDWLNPWERVLDPFSVTFYTHFMDRDNYNWPTHRNFTPVLVPELPDRIYNLPVYILLFHEAPRDKISCTLQRPFTRRSLTLQVTRRSSHVAHIGKHLTRLKFEVGATAEKSGRYTVTCKGHYYYLLDDSWSPITVNKIMEINFEKLPKIVLVGVKDNTVYFPHTNETGEFFLTIFSTSDIVTVDIARSDGVQRKRQSELIPQFLEQEFFQIGAKYKINIPWIDAGITGTYTIKMNNKNGETATLKIKLHRVEEMTVLVKPKRLYVEEGTTVSLHCLVLTDAPNRTSIKWKMSSSKELTESRKLAIGEGRGAVELTLPSTSLNQTAVYTCVADNGFQKVAENVWLTVYPRGVPEHKKQQRATWVDRMECDQVMAPHTVDNVRTASKIVVILLVLSGVAVAVVVGTVVIWKVYKRLKEKGVFDAKETTNEPAGEANDDETLELLKNLEEHEDKKSPKSRGKQKEREADRPVRRKKKREKASRDESPQPKAKDKKSSKSKSSK